MNNEFMNDWLIVNTWLARLYSKILARLHIEMKNDSLYFIEIMITILNIDRPNSRKITQIDTRNSY